ncbi:hypothetical protein FRC01_009637 [Tulasnella sp. 417]|nr:hypothetical protein FRC01_009637 [Tulasnella sp. 417]
MNSPPNSSSGARRKQQRYNKQEREATQKKRKAQAERREALATEKKINKHGRRSHRSLLKAIGRRLAKWFKDEKRILYLDDDLLRKFESGSVNRKTVAQSVQDLQKDSQLLQCAPEHGVFVLRSESQMPQPVRQPSPSSDMDISDNDSISDQPSESDTPSQASMSDQTQQPAPAPQGLRWEPRFSAIRLTNIMSEEAERAIVGAVQRMRDQGINVPPGSGRSNVGGAHHVGIWSKFWLSVYATADTLSQNMGVQKDMDDLFQLISEHVNKPIVEFLEQADPDYARTLKRINEYVQVALDDQFINPPFKHLRSLGPLFNVFAMKYGGSEISHLDLGDVPGLYAIIVVLDNFQGGDFCLPHLGYRIPLHRRSVLLVDARRLVHSTAPWTGFRFVITGFIDYNTALHAGIKTEEFFDFDDKEFTSWTQGRVFDEHAKVSKKSRKMGRSKPKAPAIEQPSAHPVPPAPPQRWSTETFEGTCTPDDVTASRPVLRRSSRVWKRVFSVERWKEIMDALR